MTVRRYNFCELFSYSLVIVAGAFRLFGSTVRLSNRDSYCGCLIQHSYYARRVYLCA